MQLVIKIKMDNAAFDSECGGAGGYEAARILRALSDRIEGHPNFSEGHDQALLDVNGNEVGYATIRRGTFKI